MPSPIRLGEVTYVVSVGTKVDDLGWLWTAIVAISLKFLGISQIWQTMTAKWMKYVLLVTVRLMSSSAWCAISPSISYLFNVWVCVTAASCSLIVTHSLEYNYYSMISSLRHWSLEFHVHHWLSVSLSRWRSWDADVACGVQWSACRCCLPTSMVWCRYLYAAALVAVVFALCLLEWELTWMKTMSIPRRRLVCLSVHSSQHPASVCG